MSVNLTHLWNEQQHRLINEANNTPVAKLNEMYGGADGKRIDVENGKIRRVLNGEW